MHQMTRLLKTCWSGSGRKHVVRKILVQAAAGLYFLRLCNLAVEMDSQLSNQKDVVLLPRPCLKLPSHISKEQRARWHKLAEQQGLASQSQVNHASG